MKPTRLMYDAYARIFDAPGPGLPCGAGRHRLRSAATRSHEFHVLAASGEDAIAIQHRQSTMPPTSRWPKRCRAADGPSAPRPPGPAPSRHPGRSAPSPHGRAFLACRPNKTVKTLIVQGAADEAAPQRLVALILRGDHSSTRSRPRNWPGCRAAGPWPAMSEIRGCLAASPARWARSDCHAADHCRPQRGADGDFVCGANVDG